MRGAEVQRVTLRAAVPSPGAAPTLAYEAIAVKSNPLLTWYRVLAYGTGCALLTLCGFMVAKYGFQTGEDAMHYVALLHGYLFMAYLAVAFFLGQKLEWPMRKLVLVMLAGTIPLASFFAERRVVRDIAPQEAAPAPAGA